MSNLIRLSNIKIGKRCRRELGDIIALMESIRSLGLLQPIALSPRHDLIDGFRRIEAVKRMGEQTISCHLVRGLDDLELLQAGLDANVCRKGPSPLEAWEMGQAIWKLEASAAKHRQREGGRRGGKMAGKGRPKENRLTGNAGKPMRRHDGETAERIARLVNMSARTYRKVNEVAVAAKKDRHHVTHSRPGK
jgi:ParB family chromosome partitioning protein